jgi:2-aminobenzoate-CoA ligase
VKAYVVAAPGVEPDAGLVTALQEHVKSAIAPYKYPREIEFIERLPKTETGKLRRAELRQMAKAAGAPGMAAE